MTITEVENENWFDAYGVGN
jgi:hypothetical protein